MITLGFSTSGPSCGALLLEGTQVRAERHEDMAKGQAERLMPMLEEMLTEAGLGWGDLDRIGVGVGPGNFTGIRLAVSAARGLSLGLGIPAIGVNAFDALALAGPRPLLVAIDARQGRVHAQLFDGAETGPASHQLDALPEAWRGLHCVGSAAEAVAERIGGQAGPAHYYPGSAVARIASSAAPSGRPSPLYMRDADAAPPREAPPVLLP